jgi:hypothetical protein
LIETENKGNIEMDKLMNVAQAEAMLACIMAANNCGGNLARMDFDNGDVLVTAIWNKTTGRVLVSLWQDFAENQDKGEKHDSVSAFADHYGI